MQVGWTELTEARERLMLAMSNGVRSVRDSNGEEVTYASVSEMRSTLRFLDSEIAKRKGARKPPSTIYLNSSKGL